MYNKEVKKDLIAQYGKNDVDTGSVEAQVALKTHRIKHLTEHLKINKKDYSSKRGLLREVGRRRSLLKYLEKKDIERYRALIAKLGLRK